MQKITSGRSYTKNGMVIAINNIDNVSYLDMHQYLDKESLISTEIDLQIMENIWDGIFLQSDVITSDSNYFIKLFTIN